MPKNDQPKPEPAPVPSLKLKVTSAVFGGSALLILLLVWESRATLSLSAGLFWCGAGLNTLIFALEPARLFAPVGTRRASSQGFVTQLDALSLVLWLVAALVWLLAQF
ncbi:hypothetical protein [Paucibacter sp. Y2R2-4]|uniref:hypothetical protein n=1 Tax=Paucibacter sp. Y2R2-4 TaxID=2893553 RepID=UPI0021E4A2CA|nr:hypothetical protein [Paucibacter sp. Y2R2-4]MCV2351489.1 hypothetical protein [Paucibacter sp. Y2R2-4]